MAEYGLAAEPSACFPLSWRRTPLYFSRNEFFFALQIRLDSLEIDGALAKMIVNERTASGLTISVNCYRKEAVGDRQMSSGSHIVVLTPTLLRGLTGRNSIAS